MENSNQINEDEEDQNINIRGFNTSRAHYDSPVAPDKTNENQQLNRSMDDVDLTEDTGSKQ